MSNKAILLIQQIDTMDKIWLVGAGYWGSKIEECLTKLKVEYSVIDIKNNQTIDEIDTLDPVILATPVLDHFESAKILLEKGHDLYVEKPLTETLAQTDELIAIKDLNQILMVGYIFLYHPHCIQLKEIIDSGKLGDITYIKTERLNWGIYQTKISPLLSLAPHDISIVQYLTGKSLTIDNAVGLHLSNNEQFDKVNYNGTSGHIKFETEVSWYSPTRKRIVTVIGTDGCAVWDADNEILMISNHHKISATRLNKEIETVYHRFYNKSPLEYELQHFINCVKTRVTPKSDVIHSRGIAEAINQIEILTTSNH